MTGRGLPRHLEYKKLKELLGNPQTQVILAHYLYTLITENLLTPSSGTGVYIIIDTKYGEVLKEKLDLRLN